ncbi:Methyladenine glycosylase [Gracilaria domingensis]|nr:Methyladenine glycosylase [Gracilaria domingensis]
MAPSSKRRKKDTRCEWSLSAPDYIQYHDEEWGVPVYDDKKMFEFLLLETFQAGLSWLTILRKRDAFANAFHDFDVDRIATMTEEDVARLQQDASIIRNKLKIRAAISNAKAVIAMREEGIGFAHYFWDWVDYVPQRNCCSGNAVSKNELSDEIAKDLKKKGFKFVGSTIIYAHLQATGVINDHTPKCPRYKQVQKLLKKKPKQ